MTIFIGAWLAVKSLNYINHDVNDVRSPHIFLEGKNNCLTQLHEPYDPHMKYAEIIASGLGKKYA